jgi:hypothetical protein
LPIGMGAAPGSAPAEQTGHPLNGAGSSACMTMDCAEASASSATASKAAAWAGIERARRLLTRAPGP